MTEPIRNSEDLYKALWNCADILRGSMGAGEYKDYLLGLVFYKYLSDRLLVYVSELLEEPTKDLQTAQQLYLDAFNDDEINEDLISEIKHQFSYIIEPKHTFTNIVKSIHDRNFELETLAQSFRDIEQSSQVFENLFDEVDLYSRKLGSTIQRQNNTISALIKELDAINLVQERGDVLGDAYEYLISEFASDTGKKAGEFYTPHAISQLMTRIAIAGKEDKKGFSVYDPTMGSGSLMLNVKKYTNEAGSAQYFGQEMNTATYNLARMNMMLHGVPIPNQHLRNGDTLDADWPVDEPTNFDAVLMNPPYSAKWTADKGFLTDSRFSPYGALAPKSAADMAFMLHGFYHLKNDGVMGIVLPHGVLFRGGAEAKIRQKLLEDGHVYAVIGLPPKIFFSTGIPTTVLILRKDYDNRDVLFIDASEEFEKDGRLNKLTDANIDKIIDVYNKRESVDKFAHLASFEEIKENDFNLNIPRYVDTFEPEPEIILTDVSNNISSINTELNKVQTELNEMLAQLQGHTPEINKELQDFIKALGE